MQPEAARPGPRTHYPYRACACSCLQTTVAVCVAAVALVLDAPDLDPESTLAAVLRMFEYIFIGAFTLESMMQIITFGFAFTGKHAYIRSGWNVLDFIIVLAGYVLLILTALIGPEGAR